MDREQARILLPLLADGELDDRQARELNALLEQSPELRDELARWKALRQAARRDLHATRLPAGIEARLLAAVQREERRGRILRLAGPLVAAAAVVIFAVTLRGSLFSPNRQGGGPAVANLVASQFVRVHENCAVRGHHDPYRLAGSTDMQAAVADASDCKAGIPIDVPVLDGFVVSGCCGCLDRSKVVKAIHVYYEDAPHACVVSLFVTDCVIEISECASQPRRELRGRVYELVQLEETGLIKWNEKLRSYTMVSRLPAAELEELANQVRVAGWLQSQPPLAVVTSRK